MRISVSIVAWFASTVAGMAVSARAQAEGRGDVVIAIRNDDDRRLLERIRGQASDLPFELVPVELPATPEEPSAPEGSKPIALFWFTRPDATAERLVLHAISVDRKRAVLREIGDGTPSVNGELASATLEAAALVVREVLRELRADETARQEESAATLQAPPAIAKAPPADPVPPTARAKSASVRLCPRLGWELALDGVAPRHGPATVFGICAGGFEAGLLASLSLSSRERDRHGEIALDRRTLGVRLGYAWSASQVVRLGVGLRGGVLLYARRAVELAPNVRASEDAVDVSLLLGPELAVSFAPRAGSYALSLAVYGDWAPAAPRIGYEVDGAFEPSFVISRFQPGFALSLEVGRERATP